MPPLRQLLASRAVIAALVAFGCLGLFVSTLDSASRPEWVKNRTGGNGDVGHSKEPSASIQWDDASIPSPGLGKSLGVYPGRKPQTVQRIIEKAQRHYERIVRQRHEMLKEFKYDTPQFDPWHPLAYYWWYFPASFACPHEIQRVGPLNDGGKWLCGMSLYEEEPRAKCVIYSFGVNHETRFEGEMLDRTNCEIFAYDASVTEMGVEAQGPRSHFKPYYIGKTDHVDAEGKVWKTLKTLMAENGHDWIDILKVDIEGNEYQTFDAIMDDFDVLPFSQLQMELHVRQDMITFPNFLKWWERLESKGVYPWWTELNLNPTYWGDRDWASEYCFLNTRGGAKNLLIQNY
ncbi:hypothetical protein BGZ80_003845 [Entomortierella chlamydospora]|uniref:Methyltransferase domain-containing protein n=1 Tax=Entomortierella chlamydospora TaxID=101097 RepID=A0A9P6N0G0_9FUNG|nr:hypothetical protein BGZ79_007693 [Entomortierella chlamydospora]KAG0020656.1 hypothetical protein BGZ80_003845 [Entomortierella chlamydospora]